MCITWLLDAPVSSSGRLKTILTTLAERQGWTWDIRIVPDPDRELKGSDAIIATADSDVLDHCGRWFNLARRVVGRIDQAWVADLSPG